MIAPNGNGRLIAFASCALLLALPADCGPWARVVNHFDLPRCPHETFVFPDAAQRAPYDFRRSRETPALPCPGLVPYAAYRNSRLVGGADVRLNRGQRCSLDIVWAYQAGTTLGKPRMNSQIEERLRPMLEALAEAVMRGSGATPQLPAASVERLLVITEDEEWVRANCSADSSRDADTSDAAEADSAG